MTGLADAMVFPDTETLARALTEHLAQLIRAAVAARGACHLAFPGGRSPRRIFELLGKCDLPWPDLHLYPGDERCVPAGYLERNDRLAVELLRDRPPQLRPRLHSIPAEMGPEEGAARFSQLLRRTPQFDVALLGVGPDGHTASLFPAHAALTDGRSAVPVFDAPNPPAQRVTIGIGRLRSARQRIVIATGQEKQEMLKQVRCGADFPVVRLEPTHWYLDSAAAALLGDNIGQPMLQIKGTIN